jgi:hypothetical protein
LKIELEIQILDTNIQKCRISTKEQALGHFVNLQFRQLTVIFNEGKRAKLIERVGSSLFWFRE